MGYQTSLPAGPSRNRRPRRRWLDFRRAVSWHRRKLAVLAVLAAVLTGISAAAPEGPPTTTVVRTATELAGGRRLSSADLRVDEVVAAGVPEGAVTDPTV